MKLDSNHDQPTDDYKRKIRRLVVAPDHDLAKVVVYRFFFLETLNKKDGRLRVRPSVPALVSAFVLSWRH